MTFKIIQLFAAFVFAIQMDGVLAQENEDHKKIHISVTIVENGEKKTITKSYRDIEELNDDPELKGEGFNFLFREDGKPSTGHDDLNLYFNFFHATDGDDPQVFKNDEGEFSDLYEKWRGLNWNLFHFDPDENPSYEFGNGSYLLKKDDDGNVYFEKDGKRIELDEIGEENGFFYYFEENSVDPDRIKESIYLKLEDLKDQEFEFGRAVEDIRITLEPDQEEINFNFNSQIKKIHKIVLTDVMDIEELSNDLVGDESMEMDNLAYYPNPSEGKFRLRFNAAAAPLQIKILDLTGREVYHETDKWFDGLYDRQIDLSHRDPGVYFLQVVQQNKTITKKLIIE